MSHGAAIAGVLVSGAVLVGLVIYGNSRAKAQREQMAKDDPTITPVSLLPGLKVGDVVLVDSALAKLPSPFNSLPRVPAEVVALVLDPSVVTVKVPPGAVVGAPGVTAFTGSIPRLAVMSVLPPVSIQV